MSVLWRACNLTSFSPCLIGPLTTCLLPVTRDLGSNPRGYLCEAGILLLALYIGDPDVIDHHGLVWGGLHPEPSLGPRANNVIIPLDLTQLFCPGFTLTAGLPSGFTTDGVGCWGEPCGDPAISLPLTMSHWSSGLPVCFLLQGTQVQIPRGELMWSWDSPVSVVSLQFQDLTYSAYLVNGHGLILHIRQRCTFHSAFCEGEQFHYLYSANVPKLVLLHVMKIFSFRSLLLLLIGH